MNILIIVPCGKRKIWDKNQKAGPIEAKDAYIGGPFKVNRKYAEKFATRWLILSAKYGFVDPNFIIRKKYSVRFGSHEAIDTQKLRKQIFNKNLKKYKKIIVLGGRDYTDKVKESFEGIRDIITPVENKSIGEKMEWLNRQIQRDSPL